MTIQNFNIIIIFRTIYQQNNVRSNTEYRYKKIKFEKKFYIKKIIIIVKYEWDSFVLYYIYISIM